jgi:hypothetical protein
MLNYNLKKVALYVKVIVIKEAKCKESSFLTWYKIPNHYKCNNCQKAIGAKDGSGNWPMRNVFKTLRQKL